MPELIGEAVIDDGAHSRADAGDELEQLGNVDVIAVFLLKAAPVHLMNISGQAGVACVPADHLPEQAAAVLAGRERELENIKDEQPLFETGSVVAVLSRNIEEQLHLEAEPQREIGKPQEKTAGPGDRSFGSGSVFIDADLFPHFLFPFLEAGRACGARTDELGARQHRTGHLLERSSDKIMHFFRDELIDPVLQALGEPAGDGRRALHLAAPGLHFAESFLFVRCQYQDLYNKSILQNGHPVFSFYKTGVPAADLCYLQGSENHTMKILHEDDGREGRFFIRSLDYDMAEIAYRWMSDGRILIDHTEVDESLKGQGIGRQLLDRVVGLAREKQVLIWPVCPFAKATMEKEAQYRDVLWVKPDGERLV